MKKFLIFFAIVLVIVAGISMIYFNYQMNDKEAKKENKQFEDYYQKEVYGADLATILNKGIDNNIKYNISKDNKGRYIENNENSIKMDIKITDNDAIYDMETISSGGVDKFVQNYNMIKFKCVTIKYHDKTKKVSYLLFEQMSQ